MTQHNEASEGPWGDYVAAAQRLDVIRRAATTAASEQAATVQAARQELAARRAPRRSMNPAAARTAATA